VDPAGSLTMPTLRDHLAREPYRLVMSSGFFGFFAHSGMLTALESEGLAPAAVAGSSAGGLVGACYAAGLDAKQRNEVLRSLTRDQFWDPAPGPGLLRGERFRRKLEDVFPVHTFEACRIPLSLSAVDVLRRRVRVFSSGELVPAVYATCAVPLLFHPIRHGSAWLTDGGVLDRPGLHGVPEGERVLYHHLASRSPWRRKNDPALKIPERSNMRSLVLEGLPRVGPFRLEEGPRALDEAYERTKRALDRVTTDPVVAG